MKKEIKNLVDLEKAIKERRAVYCPESGFLANPKPAAVTINLQGAILLSLFKRGMYIYEKGKTADQ
jgi:hypothetical protein